MTALLAALVVLGPTAAQRESHDAALEYAFVSRADERLTGATLLLVADHLSAQVVVNDETVATLQDASGEQRIRVRDDLLADRNTLSLRLRDCRAQTWSGLKQVAVELASAPTPLPDELALLPLPFFDRGYDQAATIPVAMAAADEAPLALVAASWFAADAPIPLEFEAHTGALPDSRALVLVAGARDAAALGVPAPDGPSVRMIDHPRHPGSNVKLLVIGGRDRGELRAALDSLAAHKQHLAGPLMTLAAAKPPARAEPPRWVRTDREVPFSQYPGESVLQHDGTSPATLGVRFRIPPDVSLWPSDFVSLDLGWRTRGTPAPRLDVEMNGEFVATLPAKPDGRVRLRVPREHLRGFNQLLVHVRYPGVDACAPAAAHGEPPHVEVAGDSVLHVEGASRFAVLPDVSLFAFDGWPLTRVADLGESVMVLPDAPSERELSVALSVAGHLAQITGSAGSGLSVLPASAARDEALRDKDLLVLGTEADNALLSRWAARFPVRLVRGAPHVQRVPVTLDLLGGIGPLLDARRAGALLEQSPDAAAISAIESPVTPGRTAIAIAATDTLPKYSVFLGYAESRTRAGDLLVVAGAQRAMFRIGGSFSEGHLPAWTHARFFLASHWMLLIPLLLAGAWAFASDARKTLRTRMAQRLREGARA